MGEQELVWHDFAEVLIRLSLATTKWDDWYISPRQLETWVKKYGWF